MSNATFLGKLIGWYFGIYPMIYFTYNAITPYFGLPLIPDFWAGMGAFFLLTVVKNTVVVSVRKALGKGEMLE